MLISVHKEEIRNWDVCNYLWNYIQGLITYWPYWYLSYIKLTLLNLYFVDKLICHIPKNNKCKNKRLKHIKRPIKLTMKELQLYSKSVLQSSIFFHHVYPSPNKTPVVSHHSTFFINASFYFNPFKAVFAKEYSFSMFLDGSHSVGVQLVLLKPLPY